MRVLKLIAILSVLVICCNSTDASEKHKQRAANAWTNQACTCADCKCSPGACVAGKCDTAKPVSQPLPEPAKAVEVVSSGTCANGSCASGSCSAGSWGSSSRGGLFRRR